MARETKITDYNGLNPLTVQQIIMGAVMALGCHLIFKKLPKELQGRSIQMAGRLIGLALSVIPIASFIYYFSPLRYAGAQFATAINLSAYCITSTLITLAYYILLDHANEKPIIRAHLIIGLLYPIPLWMGLCYGNSAIDKQVLTISYTVFGILALIHAITCVYYYRERKNGIQKNISEHKKTELKLIGKTIHASLVLIAISLCSPSFFRYPLWLGGVFVVGSVISFIYIYVNFQKIILCNVQLHKHNTRSHTKSEPHLDPEAIAAGLNGTVKINIEKYLQQWLEKREYLHPEVSINHVAKAALTNRTYLSRYINSTYHYSFKAWITVLRIEEAKRMMQENHELSITEIAIQTGFASAESFSHIFTRHTKQSPSKWREEHLQ